MIIIHPRAKTKDKIHHLKNFICFVGGSISDFLHGFIVKVKAKKPNEGN